MLESRFMNFPIGNLFDYHCWLATIPAPPLDASGVRLPGVDPTAAIQDFSLWIESLDLTMNCTSCSSSGFVEMAKLIASHPADVSQSATNLLVHLAEKLLGGGYVQFQIDRMLNDAPRKCNDPQAQSIQYEPLANARSEDDIFYLEVLGAVVAGLIALVLALFFSIRCVVRRRHARWLKTLPTQQLRRLLKKQEQFDDRENYINKTTHSMFTSPDVPLAVRWLMPWIILGNIGFFLSGHLSLGATVDIKAQIAGEEFYVADFFTFSIAQTTVKIWKAGGHELAILILVFSGIWPYTKQLITLTVWFLPPSRLSVSRRGFILLRMDALAKYSMVDIFVIVISLAAFR